MATIYKHPESRFFYAKYTDPSTGRRVSRSTKTENRKQARIIAGKFEGEARDAALRADAPAILRRAVELASLESQSGTLTLQRAEELIRHMAAAANPTAPESSFRRLAAGWLDKVEGSITTQSWDNYNATIKAVSKALGERADMPLRRVTQSDLGAVQSRLVASGATASTANKAMRLVRRILESAVTSGTLDRNPCAGLEALPTSGSETRLPFTVQEVRQLLAAAPTDEWHGLILLAATTGLRCGDIRTLTSANVIDGWLVIMPSKTSKTTAAIVRSPLTPACLAWLEGRTGNLFPTLAGMDKRRVADKFEDIMGKAAVPRKVDIAPGVQGLRSFHSLRHSFVSWLAEKEVAADIRKRLAGHASDKIHAGYSHHAESLQRAVASLPDLS